MSAIPDELIEQVREAADVVEIIGEHVDLRKTGSDYRGPCPFHGGSHRNLAVIPKKQMYYCFVCHEGGDVFTFYMKSFGLEYPKAVREVAAKVGITIPERSTGGPDPHEPLYSAVTVAQEWYARVLRDAPEARGARDYLVDRHFDLEKLHPLGLGFAPKGRAFLEAMAALGITEEVLVEAGLAVHPEDGAVRPRFWGRLLFPIHDLRGRVVGFGGRVLDGGEPKYLNSPDSHVFHKGRLLYNLHHAKNAIRHAGRAIAVEGYFDVLRSVEAGFENVVAPLGTGFTTEQATLLKRYAPETVLLYDCDSAGMRASFRTADELLRVGMRVSIATPPAGEDPDSLVVNGGREALAAVLDDAIDVFDRKLQLIERKGWMGSLSGRRRALDRLLPTLRAARDRVTGDLYVSRAAQALGITPDSIRREVAAGKESRWGSARDRSGEREPSLGVHGLSPRGSPRRRLRPERDLINVMVHEPVWRTRIAEQLPDDGVLGEPERELFAHLRDAPPELTGSALVDRVGPEARAMLLELMNERWGDLNFDELVEGALNRIESRPLEAELGELQRRHDLVQESEKPEIQRQIVSLRQRISKLNPARWPVIRS